VLGEAVTDSQLAPVLSVASLPPPPRNPLPRRRQIRAMREFHTGVEELRDAGGPVTRIDLGPDWLLPPMVIATSPQAGRDILGRTDAGVDKTVIHAEMRHLLGNNLFDLEYESWLPRRRSLQPVFTRKTVATFGNHMAQAAEAITDGWGDGVAVDLDEQCRRLTLRALSRSVLGIDLDGRSTSLRAALEDALGYIADRSSAPVRAPHWLPTPARRRARAAACELRGVARDVVRACRDDPGREAPLVRAMIATVDPVTGRPLSDGDIVDELIAFMLAGHDTTATTLAYALWQLGRHPDLQDRVHAEAVAVGGRDRLGSGDVPALDVTSAVIHEALRLCPPAAGLARMAKRDIAVDGYRIDAGTMLMFGIYAVHRDPTLWPDALRFDPDRFTGGRRRRVNRWQYLPFGAGARSCIGDHFATLEAVLALGTIVRRVEIRSLAAQFPVALPFTLTAASPIHAAVRRR
jgi:cytochrome P450